MFSAARPSVPRSRFRATATALAVIAGSAACTRPAPRPTSVLVITLDTTRADALSCQGAPQGLTPHLDALAARATRYTEARTVAPLTLPAHASLFTGLYPPRHGLRDNALAPLPASAHTLAEAASAAGFDTAAFVAAAVLDPAWGLDQGFAHYSSVPVAKPATGDGVHMAERPAQEVVGEAAAWLEGRSDPFLLWVHLFDPHAPYEPPPRFADRASPYLGEVAATDHAVGILLAALERTGLAGETMIVVAADHGEDLGQHGEPTHSILTYDTVMRIPLMILDPGLSSSEGSSPAVEEGLVSIVDIYPTVMDALDLRLPADAPPLDGLSLFRRPPPEERGVYFESYAGYLGFGWAPLSGWASTAGQYLHGPQPEFFDRVSGGATVPRQRRNRLEARSQAVAQARSAIEDLAALPALASGLGSESAGEVARADPELLAAVRGLGYLGAGDGAATGLPHPLARTGLGDPRHSLDQLATFYEAALMAGEGRRDEAIERLAALVAEHPGQTHGAEILAQFLQAEGRAAEAVPVLRRALEEGHGRSSLSLRLGLCLEDCGELAAAREQVERAAALRPTDPRLLREVTRLRALAGSTE